MTSSTAARVRRLLVLPALAAGLVGSLSACSSFLDGFADSPLGITADEIGWAPGEAVTGSVENPDGSMTVSLAPASPGARAALQAVNRTQDLDATGVVPCDYDRDASTYSCPTTGLDLGVHVVQVTDARQPGEGTQAVAVVLSDVPGYDPTAGDVPVEMSTGERSEAEAFLAPVAGRPTLVPLAGWAPGTEVTLRVVADGRTKPFLVRRATIGDDGSAKVRLPALDSGFYSLVATDGTWAQDLWFEARPSS